MIFIIYSVRSYTFIFCRFVSGLGVSAFVAGGYMFMSDIRYVSAVYILYEDHIIFC